MPWKEQSIVDSREEFCRLAATDGANIRALCRRYDISPTTGYVWLARYQQAGRDGLADRSRRPRHSPAKTADEVEEQVIALRREHPSWGGRKLRARLLAEGTARAVPSASSITRILHRHALIDPAVSQEHQPSSRFEAAAPNALWQMDFKGHFALSGGGRCHPLTIIDDHSRYALGIRALPHEQGVSVKGELIALFQRYGLPDRILCDNSTPWGCPVPGAYTALAVWLLLLDVRVIHGRPWHPQTQGKDERFHRTLDVELLTTRRFANCAEVQAAVDRWRHDYNTIRPHEALGLRAPITRYTPSTRSYPEQLPAIEYAEGQLVRKVRSCGTVEVNGVHYYLGQGFAGYRVALSPTEDEIGWDVYFRHYRVSRIDRRDSIES